MKFTMFLLYAAALLSVVCLIYPPAPGSAAASGASGDRAGEVRSAPAATLDDLGADMPGYGALIVVLVLAGLHLRRRDGVRNVVS